MKTYYLIATSSRSVNSIRDGSDEIRSYSLTINDPSENTYFDRYINTSESLITEFDAENDEQANRLFHQYMRENYDTSCAFAIDEFDVCEEAIACMSIGSASVEDEFYTCEDPDGVTGSGEIYPDPTDGTEYLFCVDDGMSAFIDDCPWFDEFKKIPAFSAHLESLIDDDEELDDIDWRDIEPGSDAMDEIIYILEKNGYSTETCLSPGHLDSSSPGGCGEGAIYSYIFIRKN